MFEMQKTNTAVTEVIINIYLTNWLSYLIFFGNAKGRGHRVRGLCPLTLFDKSHIGIFLRIITRQIDDIDIDR